MDAEEMKSRTKALGLRILRLCEALPDTPVARVIRNQLMRSGTSVGANYRAACRAKSKADFISKMATVEEETDESMYWMELIVEAGLMSRRCSSDLYHEADEVLAIVVSSIRSAKTGKPHEPERGVGSGECVRVRNSECGVRSSERPPAPRVTARRNPNSALRIPNSVFLTAQRLKDSSR